MVSRGVLCSLSTCFVNRWFLINVIIKLHLSGAYDGSQESSTAGERSLTVLIALEQSERTASEVLIIKMSVKVIKFSPVTDVSTRLH